MKNKNKIFLDLSKCSKEQGIQVGRLLRKHLEKIGFHTNIRLIEGVVFEDKYLYFSISFKEWCLWPSKPHNRTELTYPEFIKLFEGGEGDNNGWIKIESEADLPKENAEYYWTITENDKNITKRWFNYFFNQKEGEGKITHYQPIKKPEPPKF